MSPALLDDISQAAATLAPGAERVCELRRRWPQLHFSHCLEDEIGTFEPARAGGDFNLYLVGGQGGCAGLTRDPESATGVVVADLD